MKPGLIRIRDRQTYRKILATLVLASFALQNAGYAQNHTNQGNAYEEFTGGDCLKNLTIEQLSSLKQIQAIQDKVYSGGIPADQAMGQMDATIAKAANGSKETEEILRSMAVMQTPAENERIILGIQYRMAYGIEPAIQKGQEALVESLKNPPVSEPDPVKFLKENAVAAKPAWETLKKYDIRMSVDEDNPSHGLDWDFGYADMLKATKDPQFNAAMDVFFQGFSEQVPTIQDPDRRQPIFWGDKVMLPPRKRWGKREPVVPIQTMETYQKSVAGAMKLFGDSVKDHYEASNKASSFADFSSGLLTDRNPMWGSYDGPTAGQAAMNGAADQMTRMANYLRFDLGLPPEQMKELDGAITSALQNGNKALDEGYERTKKNFIIACAAPALPILCGATGGAFCAGMVKSVAFGTALTALSVGYGAWQQSSHNQGSFMCNLGKQWYTKGIDQTVMNIAMAPLGPLMSKGAGAVGKYGATKVLAYTGSQAASKATYVAALSTVGLPGLPAIYGAGKNLLFDQWKQRREIAAMRENGNDQEADIYEAEVHSNWFDSGTALATFLYSNRSLVKEYRSFNPTTITARAMVTRAIPPEDAPKVKLNAASSAAVEDELVAAMAGAKEKINPTSTEWRKYAGQVVAKQARMQAAAEAAPTFKGDTHADLERFGNALAAENPNVPVSKTLVTRLGSMLKSSLGAKWHELGNPQPTDDLGPLKGRAVSGLDFKNANHEGPYESWSGTVKSVRNLNAGKPNSSPLWEAEVVTKTGIRKVNLSTRESPLFVHEELATAGTAPKFATAAPEQAPLGVPNEGPPSRVLTKAEKKVMNQIVKDTGKKYSAEVRERVKAQLEREMAAYAGDNPVRKQASFLRGLRKDPQAFWKMRAETLLATEASRAGQIFRVDASKIPSLSPEENVIVGDGLGGGQEGKILGYKDLGNGRRALRFQPADGSPEVAIRENTDIYRIPADRSELLVSPNGDSPSMQRARNLDVEPKTAKAIDDLVTKYGGKKLDPEVARQVRERMTDDAIRFEENQPVTSGDKRKFWRQRAKTIVAQENTRFNTNTKVATRLVGQAARGAKFPAGVDAKAATAEITEQLIQEAQNNGKTLSPKDPALAERVAKLVEARVNGTAAAPVTPVNPAGSDPAPASENPTPNPVDPAAVNTSQNAIVLRNPNATALARVSPVEVAPNETVTVRTGNGSPMRGEIVRTEPNGTIDFKPAGQAITRQIPPNEIQIYKPQNAIVVRDPAGTALARVSPTEVVPTEPVTIRNGVDAPQRGQIVKTNPNGTVEFKPEGQTQTRQIPADQIEIYAKDTAAVPPQTRKVQVSSGSRMALPRNLAPAEIANRAQAYEQGVFEKRVVDIESRLSAAAPGSKIKLTQTQRNAIAVANEIGRGELGAHRGTTSGIGNRTDQQLADIYEVLDGAKFTPQQSNILMAEGYIGPAAEPAVNNRLPGSVGGKPALPGPTGQKQLTGPTAPKALPGPNEQQLLPAPVDPKLLPAPNARPPFEYPGAPETYFGMPKSEVVAYAESALHQEGLLKPGQSLTPEQAQGIWQAHLVGSDRPGAGYVRDAETGRVTSTNYTPKELREKFRYQKDAGVPSEWTKVLMGSKYGVTGNDLTARPTSQSVRRPVTEATRADLLEWTVKNDGTVYERPTDFFVGKERLPTTDNQGKPVPAQSTGVWKSDMPSAGSISLKIMRLQGQMTATSDRTYSPTEGMRDIRVAVEKQTAVAQSIDGTMKSIKPLVENFVNVKEPGKGLVTSPSAQFSKGADGFVGYQYGDGGNGLRGTSVSLKPFKITTVTPAKAGVMVRITDRSGKIIEFSSTDANFVKDATAFTSASGRSPTTDSQISKIFSTYVKPKVDGLATQASSRAASADQASKWARQVEADIAAGRSWGQVNMTMLRMRTALGI